MCETTPSNEWEPFYFMDLNRFPWIENELPTYGILERCPTCTDTKIRLVEPREWEVFNPDFEAESSPPVRPDENEEDWLTGESGLDLDSPGDL